MQRHRHHGRLASGAPDERADQHVRQEVTHPGRLAEHVGEHRDESPEAGDHHRKLAPDLVAPGAAEERQGDRRHVQHDPVDEQVPRGVLLHRNLPGFKARQVCACARVHAEPLGARVLVDVEAHARFEQRLADLEEEED